jgi:hypothetical protein
MQFFNCAAQGVEELVAGEGNEVAPGVTRPFAREDALVALLDVRGLIVALGEQSQKNQVGELLDESIELFTPPYSTFMSWSPSVEGRAMKLEPCLAQPQRRRSGFGLHMPQKLSNLFGYTDDDDCRSASDRIAFLKAHA